ncbi:MAG: SGNH/GDSL hydrolase family protein [Promethearchaeota archaeon]
MLFVIIIVIGISCFVVYLLINLYLILRPPVNNPRAFLKSSKQHVTSKKRILMIGDSITHGHVSGNYPKMVENTLKGKGFDITVINGGINSEHAWNVLQRLDEIMRCDPDIITILIGTNDAHAYYSPRVCKRNMKLQKLPRRPTPDVFKEDLAGIIKTLKAGTRAKIALISIPTIGEDLEDPALKISTEYANYIKELAEHFEVSYLPFHESMLSYLEKNPSKPCCSVKYQDLLMVGSIFANRFGMAWDRIGKLYGFGLHSDFLHLNDNGARMVADLIVRFCEKNLNGK